PPPSPLPLKNRLKRYPSPEEELDLHGFTAAQAAARTESWVRQLWRGGFFTLRIIVGRGIHSQFGPVLPDVVEDILIRLKREGTVLWFEWDRKRKHQSGSVIIYLKQF
ncbi:MAG: Smr/MutS family protein, partial [Desulfamplus sp.]|nr:Smr/MutS family protein [Desulfamplus sp.]